MMNPLRRGAPPVMGPDGLARPAALEDRLNKMCLAVFSTPAGKELQVYIRSITADYVIGPGGTDLELRHREGMRFLNYVLSERARLAKPKA